MSKVNKRKLVTTVVITLIWVISSVCLYLTNGYTLFESIGIPFAFTWCVCGAIVILAFLLLGIASSIIKIIAWFYDKEI